MIHIGTFCGIGGFHIAAQRAGYDNAVSCEINPFCRKVLEYYWPEAYHHDDIFTLTGKKIKDELDKRYPNGWSSNDIVFSGGFPCQPFSLAGQRGGSEDYRFLFPQVKRLLRELQPGVAVLENVFGLTSILEQSCISEVEKEALFLFSEGDDSQRVRTTTDRVKRRTLGIIIEQLEEEGYYLPRTRSGEPVVLCVPACAVNAPHRRDRIAIVAYSIHPGNSAFGNGHNRYRPEESQERKPEPQPEPGRLSKNRITANARSFRLESGADNGESGGTSRRKQPWREAPGANATDWREFPTQPPVYPGNDGLSTPLAGYTAAQWYAEFTKAVGNAVVPEWAYQIFAAITHAGPDDTGEEGPEGPDSTGE